LRTRQKSMMRTTQERHFPTDCLPFSVVK
jgi:hypothetical protein